MTDEFRRRLEPALAGQYTFERELGGGGMSRTYLAREVALNRLVVIKVLAPELLAGISVERFRREVLLAAQLQHPQIVPVLTTGDVDGIPWFAMPYVDGNSLRHRMDAGVLPLSESVAVLRDVARALAYAHRHGVVHRDIKPDNVLLSGGSATVTDFGIAKAINAARTGGGAGSAALTQMGTAIGTPAYMAPEQAAGDPETDHRADLYAFGVMAYELIAGEPLFSASSPSKLLLAHMSEQPRDLSALRPDCPPQLAALVMTCLAKDPIGRPQEANSVVKLLDGINTSGSSAAMPAILQGGRIRPGKASLLWAVASALVILTAWAATEAIGLPDWVLPGAVGVMIAGLPVILFTAFAQRVTQRTVGATPGRTPAHGTMAGLALKASPHLSWRRAWLGGAVAIGGFAALVVGFMVMRALGIGPMASLRGQGAFGAHETLVIADFASPADDSTIGPIVAEALRTDLAQSTSLRVLTRSAHRDELALMRLPPDTTVTFELARQIGTRLGAKAILDGSIDRLGSSYVVSARMITVDNRELALFRETASDQDALLSAVGKLSRQVRIKAGESFRTIRASRELDRVTTASLPALRKYVEGSRLADEAGEQERGMALLREAVELDTAFAMAWRKIAVLMSNGLGTKSEMYEAIDAAWRHKDRLTEMERLLTEGFYYSYGRTPDPKKALAAYNAAIAISVDSLTSAVNNAAVIYTYLNDWEEAEQLFRKATLLSESFGGAFTNLLEAQIINRRDPAALDSTLQRYRERFPESLDLWEAEWKTAWGNGELAKGDSIARAIVSQYRTPRQEINASWHLAELAELTGRVGEAQLWNSRSAMAQHRLQPNPGTYMWAAMDSAYYQVTYGSSADAIAIMRRAMVRGLMDSMPPTDRPWGYLAHIALLLGDADMVRHAVAGAEHDQLSSAPDPDGTRARNGAFLALAEHRWNDAIRGLTMARDRFALQPRAAAYWIGRAYREKGNADSAVAYFESFVKQREATANTDATWLAEVRQHLGELYEQKGDRTQAAKYYRDFVEQWKNADPSLQPRVSDVRERIARLEREGG